LTFTLEPVEALRVLQKLSSEYIAKHASNFSLDEVDAQAVYPELWVTFRNATTQVEVHFEYETAVWLTLSKLVRTNGDIVGGEGYSLAYILSVRAPDVSSSARVTDFDESRIKEALERQIAVMAKYAGDVLCGDFSIFARLKELSEAEVAKWNAQFRSG
jgi:hypothetical protein